MLEPILESTRQRVAAMKTVYHYRSAAQGTPAPRDFSGALAQSGLSVIAEVKRRSPSRGDLAPDLDPAQQASLYAAGGASCISVLTEPHHFGGSDEDLRAARRVCDLPVIRKDFTLDERQIWEARAIGADAVLLIVAALGQDILERLHDSACEAGLAALVEVHDESEAERALAVGARIVGVNNRDLNTFAVSLTTAERLAPMLKDVPVTVAESGVHAGPDASRMRAAGYDAVLVGESLVRSPDPTALIREFRS